jgi:hypothetical protein
MTFPAGIGAATMLCLVRLAPMAKTTSAFCKNV